MAFEPPGKAASNIDTGAAREVPEASRPSPAFPYAGFKEQSALFRSALDLPVELRALRGCIDSKLLQFAAVRAEQIGVGADVVIARSGAIGPDVMLAAYAADLGVEIDFLENTTTSPMDALETLSSGILPAEDNGNGATIALLPGAIRSIYERAATGEKFRITSAERLRAFVERSAESRLADQAAFGLRDCSPEYSAAVTRFANYRTALLAALLGAALCFYYAPGPARFTVEVMLAVLFLAWAGLRLFACFAAERLKTHKPISDRDLPAYTVLIPLYREAAMVPDLVAAISALNYPREKLEVKLILEPDDAATIAAVKAVRLDPSFEITISSLLGPRTKPKALRAAMPFVRGEFVVIYDAEDRPHPDQLRNAYTKFRIGSSKLACVQAKLAIDNTYPSFLTAHFRAEYTGLFDVLLPALARLQLPLPLGGTSNHFRASVLREVGAWDPHNVTEDADLGMRIARFGYTTDVLDSTTWEEAPSRLGAWLPQRTRWFKGWLQTYMVHMRNPLLLLRQLGWRGFIAFQILIGGSVLAALVHPVFAALLVIDAALGSLFSPAESPAQWLQKSIMLATLMSGYLASGVLAFVGMRRRGLLLSAWVLPTIPIYWLFLSVAAWRAVWKLITAPYQWEKTAHGVVKRGRAENVVSRRS